MPSSQPALEPDPAVVEIDKAMQAWFPVSIPIVERQPFSEVDLRGLSDALRSTGYESWSRVPRIYATLRSINQLPLIDVFLTQGLSDVWLPFSHKSLPNSIRSQTARNDFIAAQWLVLNTSLDLEKEDGKHKHFLTSDDVPLKSIKILGQGRFGVVDKVTSTVSHKGYARKLLPRGPTFRRNKDILRDFEQELAALKKLSHFHIVELVGSYTDPKFVGILTSPVADCNLEDYLEKPLSKNMNLVLRTSFGCLVAAVNYLQQSRIRHKDIKPSNILVHGQRILITDFGISHDWSDEERGTTTGPTAKTPRYCAPEVAHCQPRNSLSDIWSLGCVFFEILTVLCGESTSALEIHLKSNGSKSTCYYSNTDSVGSWNQILTSKIQDSGLILPQTWISKMMEIDQKRRCNAQMLFDMIQDSSQVSDARYSFMGQCCMEEDDTEGSVIYFEDGVDMDPIAPKTMMSSATSHGSSATCRPAHLSMRAREDSLDLIGKDDISGRNLPESEVDETTERPAKGTKMSQGHPDPPFVLPRVFIKEPTLPRQPQVSVTGNAVLQSQSASNSMTTLPPNPITPSRHVTPELPSTSNPNFLSVPDIRARKSGSNRDSSSSVTSETTIALKVLSDGTQKRFKVEFLSLLHSNIFFDTLRFLLSIPSDRRILVERYSYNAATWTVLDPENQTIWKAMLRAAKAKLKLSLKITTMSTMATLQDHASPPSNDIKNGGIDQRDSTEGQLVLVRISFRNKVKEASIPLKSFLHAPTLLSALHSELDTQAHEEIIFERYSDSADKHIVLDPANEQTHKQNIRAARSKGKIRIRATISGGKTTVENAHLRGAR